MSFSTVELQFDYTILDIDTMVKKSLLSFLLITILTTLSPPAQAGYEGDTHTVNMIEDSFSLFPRHFYTLELFNNPKISETKFTLRFASYGTVSGCNSMYESFLETKEVFGTIKLTVYDSEISLNDDPRYSNYDCEVKHNRSFFDVELDRDDLIKNGTKHIKLKSKSYGNFATFDVNVNKQKVTLSIKNKDSTFMQTLWFFPENTVILHAPEAKLGQDVQALIKEFGTSLGLIQMEDNYKGFELPYNANSYSFFIDPKKKITSKLIKIGENIEVGSIEPTRTIYDASGAKQEAYNIKIYATLPGKEIKEKIHDYDDY